MVLAIVGFIMTVWGLSALARLAAGSLPKRTVIQKHRLSDRDQLIVITKGDAFWAGLYTADPPADESPAPTSPEWWRNVTRN